MHSHYFICKLSPWLGRKYGRPSRMLKLEVIREPTILKLPQCLKQTYVLTHHRIINKLQDKG